MAQLDTDVRYIASEISLLSNNNSTLSLRISETEKQVATLLEWKRSQTK
jgi:prefoldin subunit 5